jgi:ABC-type xylose transport system permease subunit
MKEFFIGRFQTIEDFFKTQRLPVKDWVNLLSWEYWTESGLPSSSVYTAFSLGAVSLGVILLLLWRARLKRAHQDVPVYNFEIQQLSSVVAFVVVMSLSYWFFRAQQIAFASSRLVLLVAGLILAVWLVVITVHLKRNVPKMRTGYLEKERFFRYLPKKRK